MASMKKIASICLLALYLFSAPLASAHLIGQAPFFEVNGKYSNFYSVPTTSLTNFPLAQDQAPDNYIVNQPITFKLDTSKLPVPPEIIKMSQFTWDFGDGEKGSGLTNTHTYKKMGSYLLSISVDDGTNPTPQLLESVQLQILPFKGYQLPKAIIALNNLTKPNAANNEFHLPMHKDIIYNATQSISGSSPIKSYFWDLGDSNSSTKPQLMHTFPADMRLAFVVLRVTDKNGFINDAYTALRNDKGIVLQTKKPSSTQPNIPAKLLFPIIGASIIALGIISGLLMMKKPHNKV